MLTTILAILFPIVAVGVAALIAVRVMKKSGNAKRSFGINLAVIGIMLVMFTLFSFGASAEAAPADDAAAQTTVEETAQTQTDMNSGLGLIAAGLCTGLAGIGGGIALASGVPAAIGAVSEDPSAFGKSLIFVALGETIALYGVVISVMILSNL